MADVAGLDIFYEQFVTMLRDTVRAGPQYPNQLLSDVVGEMYFECLLSDGVTRVDLKPNGADILVTLSSYYMFVRN